MAFGCRPFLALAILVGSVAPLIAREGAIDPAIEQRQSAIDRQPPLRVGSGSSRGLTRLLGAVIAGAIGLIALIIRALRVGLKKAVSEAMDEEPANKRYQSQTPPNFSFLSSPSQPAASPPNASGPPTS
jgi:hypothetical protein